MADLADLVLGRLLSNDYMSFRDKQQGLLLEMVLKCPMGLLKPLVSMVMPTVKAIVEKFVEHGRHQWRRGCNPNAPGRRRGSTLDLRLQREETPIHGP